MLAPLTITTVFLLMDLSMDFLIKKLLLKPKPESKPIEQE
jgi:hypothetical protein